MSACNFRYVLLFLGLAWLSMTAALDVPHLAGYVNDSAGLLSEASRDRITSSLQQLETAKGAQVVVLTIPRLQGDSLEDYSIRVVESWKLGRKDVDDGVLLLVARDERKIRIEVGYGLEGVLTDLDSRRIIDHLMVPAFRSGDFEKGIEAAVKSISGAIIGEQGAIPAVGEEPVATFGRKIVLGVFGLIMMPFVSFAVALKGRQGWLLYGFLAPFFYFLPLMLGETAALISFFVWLAAVPVIRVVWPDRWSIEPGTDGGLQHFRRSRSRGSSGGSGVSGRGGGFGGGGASGGW